MTWAMRYAYLLCTIPCAMLSSLYLSAYDTFLYILYLQYLYMILYPRRGGQLLSYIASLVSRDGLFVPPFATFDTCLYVSNPAGAAFLGRDS